ncbi:MAG: type I restriction enzyme HsdR N-terminal domain-containing protein [Bacteroidota bacterium]
MRLLKKGLKDRYIVIDKKRDKVTYLPQGKERKFSNPEEQVQLETYLDLIYNYGYPPEKLKVCQKVKIGSSSREADIVVYTDKACTNPYVIVECKKANVSNHIFEGAIDQGFSYAAVTNAEYVWATSGDRDAMYEVFHDAIQERNLNRISRIPRHKEEKSFGWSMKRSWRWLRRHPALTDTLVFSAILLLFTGVSAKLCVEYFPQIYKAIEGPWKQWNMDFNWIYNAIIATSASLSLVFGGLFMRSHKIFKVSTSRKWFSYVIIGLILFLPSWWIGESMGNPDWWKWITYNKYLNKGYPIVIYIWPYVKALPFQIGAIFGLIWLLGRSKEKK